MAEKRKLQGEIDRCLKKVQEGVEAFEEIWKKMDATNNLSQKEKFEGDLKKEIKKLQRLRDQIKAWAVQPDIKDKQILADNRKLIETQMERFKVIEREAKIKAYSKEGLGTTGKVDPKEKEKEEIRAWLVQSISDLNVQVDKIESEIEAITSKKKKPDREEIERLETHRMWLGKHRFHINKLEAILRMVDNSAVQFDEIRKIHEGVEHYIESNQEPDFVEDEFIYDELDLEEVSVPLRPDVVASSPSESSDIEVLMGNSTAVSDIRSPSVNSAPNSHSKHKVDDEGKRRQKSTSEDMTTSAAKSNLTVKISNSISAASSGSSSSKVPQTPTKTVPLSSTAPSTPVDTPSARSLASNIGYAQVAGSHHSQTPNIPNTSAQALDHDSLRKPVSQQPQSPAVSSVKLSLSSSSNGLVTLSSSTASSFSPLSSLSSIANAAVAAASSTASSSLLVCNRESPVPTPTTTAMGTVPTLQSFASSSITVAQSASQGFLPMSSTAQQQQQLSAPFKFSQQSSDQSGKQGLQLSPLDNDKQRLYPSQMSNGPQNETSPSLLSLVQSSGMDVKDSLMMLDNNPVSMPHQQNDSMQLDMSSSLLLQSIIRPLPSGNDQSQLSGAPVSLPSLPATTTIRLNPLYGVAPLGPIPFNKDQIHRLNMLDAAYRHLPHPSDSERPRTYFPSNPCPTPTYYPLASPPMLNSPDFFNKLDTNSLFFIFYYMEGTKAQFLAAKALKQKSWRFHTKYMMWFQRHEEPKTITEEFEQGTYIYFDYEKWSQRKKEDFKFEYRYLEDHDLS